MGCYSTFAVAFAPTGLCMVLVVLMTPDRIPFAFMPSGCGGALWTTHAFAVYALACAAAYALLVDARRLRRKSLLGGLRGMLSGLRGAGAAEVRQRAVDDKYHQQGARVDEEEVFEVSLLRDVTSSQSGGGLVEDVAVVAESSGARGEKRREDEGSTAKKTGGSGRSIPSKKSSFSSTPRFSTYGSLASTSSSSLASRGSNRNSTTTRIVMAEMRFEWLPLSAAALSIGQSVGYCWACVVVHGGNDHAIHAAAPFDAAAKRMTSEWTDGPMDGPMNGPMDQMRGNFEAARAVYIHTTRI